MRANALILTEKDLLPGSDKENPNVRDFQGLKPQMRDLEFVAYANGGKLKVFKFREGLLGFYQMHFNEYVKAKAMEGAYA